MIAWLVLFFHMRNIFFHKLVFYLVCVPFFLISIQVQVAHLLEWKRNITLHTLECYKWNRSWSLVDTYAKLLFTTGISIINMYLSFTKNQRCCAYVLYVSFMMSLLWAWQHCSFILTFRLIFYRSTISALILQIHFICIECQEY